MPSPTDQLASWGLTVAQAEAAGLYPVADARSVHPSYPEGPAIVLPYHDPDGRPLLNHAHPFHRIRRLDLPPPKVGFGKPAKAAKYLQPPRSGMHVYLAPGQPWRATMADTRIPLLITEGEAKALAGCASDFLTIGLGGVWSFTAPGGTLLEELEAFAWSGRDAYIVFDSDAADNPQVVAAEARLVYDLQSRLNARARVVRLPPAEDGSKQGLDDFLRTAGPDELDRLLRSTAPLSPLDAKIVSLNASIAWIEAEGQVFDMDRNDFVQKADLTSGSRWSAVKHISTGKAGKDGRAKVTETSVAQKWLTHSHAARYGAAIFRPGEGPVVADDSGHPALNMWRDMQGTPGDVEPFLALTRHVFGGLTPDIADIPLKLFAYKAQNLAEKIPIALVLVGTQGSGKTLWGEIIRDAFAPYSYDVTPKQLGGEFQGWLERGLVALVNEAEGEDIAKAGEQLKTLISDLRRPMNEKFRKIRDVNTYTQYIITSNKRSVGSYSFDDRRMFVISTPLKREKAFYDRLHDWKLAGGPKHVLHYLQTLDLKGWRPPQEAPTTPEKVLAYEEGLTAIQKLANDMRNASDQTIYLWLSQAEAWAQAAEVGNDPRAAAQARAVRASIASTQIRPWYTPEELALMFPSVMLEVTGARYDRTTPVGRLSRELRDAGIPYLVNTDDIRGFLHQGFRRQYLVVAQFDEWAKPIGQSYFERCMQSWPTFTQYRKTRS